VSELVGSSSAAAFHRRLPGYQSTRLVRLDAIATELGLERLWIKDESYRLGLPAFKVLGVSWAVYRVLLQRLDSEPDWQTIADLRAAVEGLRPLTLVTATAGNHGRALAHVAGWFGLDARIYIPQGAPRDRVMAIAGEGAEVVEVPGTYDDAVVVATAWVNDQADDRALLISDTAAEVNERVPAWISEGYETMFWELDEELDALNEPAPDLVVVQMGVGSLAAAAVSHYRRPDLAVQPRLVGVETTSAACILESARVGQFRTVPGPHESLMFCLNAGRPSRVSLDGILAGFDAFIAVGDRLVGSSMQALARAGVVAGPTGTAGLVGLLEVMPSLADDPAGKVVLINTEGAADPSGYAEVLRASPQPLALTG
jgi:diaminopropionate ammonia-lyase